MPRIVLTLSSRTGNTLKIAKAAIEAFQDMNFEVEVHELDAYMKKQELELEYSHSTLNADLLVLCFWCDKSNLDNGTRRFLQTYGKGCTAVALGTFGGYPESPYADKVRNNVSSAIRSAGGVCKGIFLSQGKVRMDNIESRCNLPIGNPHRLDEAGVARVLESQNHPNLHDIEQAKKFCKDIIRHCC